MNRLDEARETADGARHLLGRDPADAEATLTWLGEVWQYFLDTGLHLAGGPLDEATRLRLRLIDDVLATADRIDSPAVRAEANRITAHVMNAAERYQEAVRYYRIAIPELEAVGETEVASRTRLGFSAALMHTGAYEDALAVCQAADEWFIAQGDEAAHARVLVNTGNIYHRNDEHQKALECQLEAAAIFERLDSGYDNAVTSLNIANSYSILDEFEASDAMYERADEIASAHGLDSLADQARYNRAYLQFLRGRYSDSITSFNALRRKFDATGSVRHSALCDLDLSEVYLQLNLSADARMLAGQAQTAFRELGMAYEEAKATVFMGVAETQQHRYQEALDLFSQAAPMFAEEDNSFWVGMTELYRAEVLLALGRHWETRFLGESALDRFEALGTAYQTGMSLIVLGRTALATGDETGVQDVSGRLLALVEHSDVPLLKFPAYVLCGQNAESNGDIAEARRLYTLAAESVEEHRAYLQHDELRVRFLDGKQSVYESLVHLDLQVDEGQSLAFSWCERAKARALADLLGQHLSSMRSETNPQLLEHITRLREELNSDYVRSRHGEDERRAAPAPERIAEMQAELERGVRELSLLDAHFGSIFSVSPRSAQAVCDALPENVTLAEFFVARGEVMVFVLGKASVQVHRHLTSIERVQQLGQSLEFQMRKFELGEEYIKHHHQQMLDTTARYLGQLYDILFAPWVEDVTTDTLVIVPHAELHSVPMHALYDGTQYLCDRFRVSYTPSAEVFCVILDAPRLDSGAGLLVGQSDEFAPAIDVEIHSLAAMMPSCRVLSGDDATRQSLLEHAGNAGFIHIATHSFFRKDNPMFSGFNLADGPVTALDLYSQSWPCELVTLSGCSSGLAEVSEGEDLMGLVRGFMHAGARALLVSQWNVSDEVTVTLIEAFYRHWQDGLEKAGALALAMREVREQYPHPFYWAPFMLIGAD